MGSRNQDQLIDDQLENRRKNARKLFYKVYDHGFTLRLDGQAAIVEAPEGKKVTGRLRSAVNGYRYELASLCRPMDTDAVSEAFQKTLRAFADQYPACRGVDLTPFDQWLHAADEHYRSEDYARMRYALMKASVVAKELIKEGRNNPIREVEGAA